jgi:alpha-glucosidase (family GH31 glycosyl hydrolase)
MQHTPHGTSLALVSAIILSILVTAIPSLALPITAAGQPGVLDIRAAGPGSIRINLKPVSFTPDFPKNPVLPDRGWPEPALTLRELGESTKAMVGEMSVEVRPDPLTIIIRGRDGIEIQTLTFQTDGTVLFALDDQSVLGMGEGGPQTPKGVDWRKVPVEFDRRGRLDKMEPRWQREAYGSRNPVALMIGTRGWGLFFATPWGQIDLTQADAGRFSPIKPIDPAKSRQTFKNQEQQLGKGIPPMDSFVPGLLDVFVFDARNPEVFMKDVASISGQAVMPPKWALGYMQSHRTLEDDKALIREVDTFREKRIPIDAVIYLGTGFTPRGWNKPQPSFEFNPQIFKRNPADVIADLHKRNIKVSLHMVPWDRDRLPTLLGSIPPKKDEKLDASHIADYWKQHETLVKAGVDAWWPDEGDWLDLFERMKRHQLYYEGPISSQPDRRPWSLHRNGHLGVARYGGWMWSGDTDSSWKTLEAQIAVGINHSLSVGPYWGTDLGGFFSGPELTGELYARWFQFAAFCPSFRAHGRTWWTRLPWGWGLNELGPIEDKEPPLLKELNNPAIEPIAKRYAELRYQLLSYNYTLAWQARETGLPFMRALWLHYPADKRAASLGNEYLWGRDLLVAPVFEKGATTKEVYLPEGLWYDWWTGEKQPGGRTVTRPVDLATMPIYARAGAIIPIDPIRQFTGEKVNSPLSLRIYRGADGDFTLYEDDGQSQAYLKGDAVLTRFRWNNKTSTLAIERQKKHGSMVTATKSLRIEIFPERTVKHAEITGKTLTLDCSSSSGNP